MSDPQAILFGAKPEIPEHRVRALAGVLAGFQWPDRTSFEKLTKPQKRAAMEVAQFALETLARMEEVT